VSRQQVCKLVCVCVLTVLLHTFNCAGGAAPLDVPAKRRRRRRQWSCAAAHRGPRTQQLPAASLEGSQHAACFTAVASSRGGGPVAAAAPRGGGAAGGGEPRAVVESLARAGGSSEPLSSRDAPLLPRSAAECLLKRLHSCLYTHVCTPCRTSFLLNLFRLPCTLRLPSISSRCPRTCFRAPDCPHSRTCSSLMLDHTTHKP
jgi:hypothetical protein